MLNYAKSQWLEFSVDISHDPMVLWEGGGMSGIFKKLTYFEKNNICLLLKCWKLIGKDSDAGKDWRQEEKGATEDEMVGYHHWVNGHVLEHTTGDSEGQGKPGMLQSMGQIGHDLVAEQQQHKCYKHR